MFLAWWKSLIVHAIWWKFPHFNVSTKDYEEPLMFCLNEEDEEDYPPQSDSGKRSFYLNRFLELPSTQGYFSEVLFLFLYMELILDGAVPQLM